MTVNAFDGVDGNVPEWPENIAVMIADGQPFVDKDADKKRCQG